MIQAQLELERFLDRRVKPFADALIALAASMGRQPQEGDALNALARLMQETLILADLHGRKRLLMELDHSRWRGKFAEYISPIVPSVPFEEALEDLLQREPRLARSAEEVSRLYSTGKVFAMAHSSSMILTQRIQASLRAIMESGEGLDKSENEILRIATEESHDFARSYAATVYRTTVSTAYAQGRFEQAKDPDVAEAIPAFRFVALLDDRVRDNHAAADGLIAATDDPIWLTMRPPLGFQCRCGLEFVSVFDLERLGRIKGGVVTRYEPPGFAAAGPDPGFRPGGMIR